MKNTKQKDVLKQIADFLHDRCQMVIATNGEHPWIATVYYSLDGDLNIYFLSDPKTLHCRHIATNPHVSISISDAPQNLSSKKKGMQIYGIAEEIFGEKNITQALHFWRKTLGVTSEEYTYEGMKKNKIKGRIYKVVPKKIKFYNEELWEDGDEKMISL